VQLSPPPPPGAEDPPFFCGALATSYSGSDSTCVDTYDGANLMWPDFKVGPASHPDAFNFGVMLGVDVCRDDPQLLVSLKYHVGPTHHYLPFHYYPLTEASNRRHPVMDITYGSPGPSQATMELLINITGSLDKLNVGVAFGAFKTNNPSCIDHCIPVIGAALPAPLIMLANVNGSALAKTCPVPGPSPPPPRIAVDTSRNAVIGYCVISFIGIVLTILVGIACRRAGEKAADKKLLGDGQGGFPAINMQGDGGAGRL
jgi:hypothetical protein